MKMHVILFALVSGLIFSCAANEAVQSAAKTVSMEVTGGKLGKLYKTRALAESAEQKEMIIKACVAGLYAIGDVKNAVKIKKNLEDGDFVSSFKSECDRCEGTGKVSQKCYKCKGTGKCQNWKCNEGMVTSPGFNGQSTTRKCSTCNGTGACKNCRGSGEVSSTCAKCRGSKMVVDKDKAMEVCKALLKTLSMSNKETKANDDAEAEAQKDDKSATKKTVEPEREASCKVNTRQGRRAESQLPVTKNLNAPRVKKSGTAHSLTRDQNTYNTTREQNAQSFKLGKGETYVIGGCTWSYTVDHGDATISGVLTRTGVIRIPAEIGADNFPVTRIGSGAFEGSKGLIDVVIPDSVEAIGSRAFAGCENLNSVTIPDSVMLIGEEAFEDCKKLNSVDIGNKVTEIGGRAFKNCTRLRSLIIPGSVGLIMNAAFCNCTHLTSVTFSGNGLRTIGWGAFENCSSLTDITIPGSVTHITDGAFSKCSALKKVAGDCASAEISTTAFDDCPRLIDDDGFVIVLGTLLRYSGKGGYVAIPDSVTVIGSHAFENCRKLTGITMPDSVIGISESAFSGCENMAKLELSNSLKFIGDMAFYECRGLASMTIPDSVTRIGENAFLDCSNLTKVSIPESFERYKDELFEGCKKLSIKRGVSVRRLAGTLGYEERIEVYRKKALAGDADAQFELGACYATGKGVKKDAAEAARWWRMAVDQGHAQAQFELGCLYYQGIGVKEDGVEVFKLWSAAAQQGHPEALCNLGNFYYHGMGVPQDKVEGIRLLRRAVEGGSRQAREILNVIYQHSRSYGF